MNEKPIKPTILDCGYFKFESSSNQHSIEKLGRRIVRDYEIDFNISGNRVMILDGIKYDIMPNTIVFKYPGQTVQSTENFDMYTLTIQLIGSKKPQKNIRQNDYGEIQSTEKGDYFSYLLPYFSPMHYNEIVSDYIKLSKIYSVPEQYRECEQTLDHLLFLLFADAIADKQRKKKQKNGTTNMEAAIEYMEEHYQNSKLSLKDIAKFVNVSESYFVRLFKTETGSTPKEYLNSIRMRQAKWHVTYTTDPIYTISYLCGFENPQYFISKFKAMYGMTPQAYRKKVVNHSK